MPLPTLYPPIAGFTEVVTIVDDSPFTINAVVQTLENDTDVGASGSTVIVEGELTPTMQTHINASAGNSQLIVGGVTKQVENGWNVEGFDGSRRFRITVSDVVA